MPSESTVRLHLHLTRRPVLWQTQHEGVRTIRYPGTNTRILVVALIVVCIAVGLNAGRLQGEFSHMRYDLHRLRHHLDSIGGESQPDLIAASLPPGDRIVIDTTRVRQTIPSTFFGINYSAFWDAAQGSAASERALAQTPIRTIRFPGGAPADWYDWQQPYYKGWSSTSPKQLWTYARSFGARSERAVRHERPGARAQTSGKTVCGKLARERGRLGTLRFSESHSREYGSRE